MTNDALAILIAEKLQPVIYPKQYHTSIDVIKDVLNEHQPDVIQIEPKDFARED